MVRRPEQVIVAREGQVREFAATVACFARTAGTDKPSALFLKRASEFAKRPPGPGWESVNSLESK